MAEPGVTSHSHSQRTVFETKLLNLIVNLICLIFPDII